jgi:hypothetical protein
MSQIWVVKTVLVATGLFVGFIQGFRRSLPTCKVMCLLEYCICQYPWSLEKARIHKAKLFPLRIQVKKTIMKEQDWPYRYDNGYMINMVQMPKTVRFDTDQHGNTPTGSSSFVRTPYRDNLLSQLYILRVIRRGGSSLSDWALRRMSNSLEAYVPS